MLHVRDRSTWIYIGLIYLTYWMYIGANGFHLNTKDCKVKTSKYEKLCPTVNSKLKDLDPGSHHHKCKTHCIIQIHECMCSPEGTEKECCGSEFCLRCLFPQARNQHKN
ncbi:unnamed protein product [Owenia fusiformis]|uniref:Uncharacterized protein n=1 Tax=Owenia fusiformis TaxID=6347 RepID=A0A8S4NUX0_OWEFU|nr:unnamed protein product [Owenia fusiformis]